MRINVELTNDEVKALIVAELERKIGTDLKKSDVKIEVKTTQNYKAEWEFGQFRVSYVGDI